MSTEQTRGTRLRPQEREAAELRLQEAVGEGLIELDEFEERIDIVLKAQTRETLEPAVAGLPIPIRDAAGARRIPVRRVIAAVLGKDEATGRWRPAEETVTVAALGETLLDFREAQLDRDEVAVTAVAVMGEVTIVVPPEVEVHMSGLALLGERSNTATAPVDDRGPVLRLRAFAVMGEVKVRTRERDHPRSDLPATKPLTRWGTRDERTTLKRTPPTAGPGTAASPGSSSQPRSSSGC